MVQNGKTLSMHSEAIWKGTYDDNGMLLKLHENCFTIGYSALLTPNGKSAGTVQAGWKGTARQGGGEGAFRREGKPEFPPAGFLEEHH